jgi:HEAT repeat protein
MDNRICPFPHSKEKERNQKVVSLIIWIISLSIVMWTHFDSANAQGKIVSQSELMMASPNRLLEIYDATTQPTELNAIVEAILAKRESSLPALRQILMTGTEKQKLLSLSLLIEMRDKRSGDILIKSLKDKDLKVQRRTAYALGYFKHEGAYGPLVAMLETIQDLGVIKSILAGLGMLGRAEAIPIIRPWLNHSDSSIRVNAAISLATMGSDEGLFEVIRASMSEDNQTRREGTFGLGFFKDNRAVSRLREIIADPKAPWQTEAHIALLRIDLSKKVSQERLDLLQENLGYPNIAVRKWVIDEISELGTPEAIKVLRSVADKQTQEGKQAKRKLLALGFSK